MRADVRLAMERAVRRAFSAPHGPVSTADLARAAGFSTDWFGRIFLEATGETVQALVRRVRMERAAYRLRFDRLDVATAAWEAGFVAPEAFCRAFRRVYGATPSEFARSEGHVSRLPSRSGVHWSPESPPALTRKTMISPKIIPFGAKRCAALRHVGETPGIDRSWAVLNERIAAEGLRTPETRFFTLSHDGPEVDPSLTRHDLLFTLSEGQAVPEGLTEVVLPAGRYAVFVHQGPDDNIVDTWARAFHEWLPQSGETFDCVCFEEYVNGFYLRPEGPDERLIVTAVYLKVDG